MDENQGEGGAHDGTGVSRRSALAGIGSLGLLGMVGGSNLATAEEDVERAFFPLLERDSSGIRYEREDESFPLFQFGETAAEQRFPFEPLSTPYPTYVSLNYDYIIRLGSGSQDGVDGVKFRFSDPQNESPISGSEFMLETNSDASSLDELLVVEGGSHRLERNFTKWINGGPQLLLDGHFHSPPKQFDFNKYTDLGIEAQLEPADAFEFALFRGSLVVWMGVPQTHVDNLQSLIE